MKRDGMNAADFSAASGYAFDLGYQAAAHQRLKRICADVEK